MALALLTPPAASPVTLDEAKRHLRVETGDDDGYLTDLIAVSTSHLEAVAGLKLISQTWRQYFDCAPSGSHFRLDVQPVQAILAMRVFEAGGVPVELAPSSIILDSVSSPPRLEVRQSLSTGQVFNGIEIDILAGHGDTPVDVPDGLKRALLLLIAHSYEFRGAVPLSAQPASEPHGFRALIAPYRRILL